MKARLRQEFRDLTELILIPGIAAVLPWKWCFAIFKGFARCSWLYRGACEDALIQAHERGWAGQDESEWLFRRRLCTLIDHADLYLSLTRSNDWMNANLEVRGAWPEPAQAGILCTFHWGAGMWGLRHARSVGLSSRALVAPLNVNHFARRRILYQYAKLRTSEVTKVLGIPALDVSESLRPAIRALNQKETLMAAVDVPADTTESSMPIRILNLPAAVPRALLRMGVRHQVPIYVYVTGINMKTGKRWLDIKQMTATDSLEILASNVFAELERYIIQDSAAWHFWAIAPRFFTQNKLFECV